MIFQRLPGEGVFLQLAPEVAEVLLHRGSPSFRLRRELPHPLQLPLGRFLLPHDRLQLTAVLLGLALGPQLLQGDVFHVPLLLPQFIFGGLLNFRKLLLDPGFLFL
ncbi:mCG1050985 [Mus musculus]|nr:mCG1050985 [Mus musculus]